MADETSKKSMRERVDLYRRYKRMLSAIDLLNENQVVLSLEAEILKQVANRVYDGLKAERKKHSRPPGRPKSTPKPLVRECRKPGCSLPPAPGQVYCSREHAPFGFFFGKRTTEG
jgi:hypothetical protein